MAIRTVLNEYRKDVDLSRDIIALAHSTTPRGRFLYDYEERSFLTQSAYLKIFIAWETFLEQTFINYLLGKKSILNRKVTRFVKPTSMTHASNLTIGTNTYFDWSRPDFVVKLGRLYFLNGDPYNAVLSSIQGHLFDMKTIRNAAAHLSTTTLTNLISLAARLLGGPHPNIKPYDLLQTTLPGSAPPISIMGNYIQILDAAAQAISEA